MCVGSRNRVRFAATASARYFCHSHPECSFIVATLLTLLCYLRHCWLCARIAIALQIIAAAWAAPALSAEPLVSGNGTRLVQREILALYDGRDESRPDL